MKKNNKFYLIISLFLFLFLFSYSHADENLNFLSLKNNEVNLRQGPSFEFPVKLVYKKKYLPVIIIDKSETWRQIKDFKNNSGWIHVSQLSKKKSAINKKEKSVFYNRPTIYSKPIAMLEKGRLVLVIKCKDMWCKITSGGFHGWIDKNSLWGKIE